MNHNDTSHNHTSKAQVFYAHIITFHDDPYFLNDAAHSEYPLGAMVTTDAGKIAWVGSKADLPKTYQSLPTTDYGNKYLMAGFIDPHLHYPQYRMLAAPGKNLMDWLTRFTFKEEARYNDQQHAAQAAEHFLDFLLMHGTTSALAFSSVHKSAADILFSAADKRNMAFFTGKTMMDRNAPDDVTDQAEQAAIDTEALIQKWHGQNRLRYAITPRFAITSSDAQLSLTGELYQKYPDCYMQTHLSESLEEIELVKGLFPWAKDYTDVYEHFGLLRKNSFFGHAIHLSERECTALSQTDSTIVHCPTSNTFLGSGHLSLGYLRDKKRPVNISLATDIGGGTSYSMLHTIGEAFKVATFNNVPFSALQGFYMATLGNAKNLGLADEIGALKTGNWADFIIIDPCATPLLTARQELSETLEESLFALAILGDDRAIKATYVAGNCLHKRG